MEVAVRRWWAALLVSAAIACQSETKQCDASAWSVGTPVVSAVSAPAGDSFPRTTAAGIRVFRDDGVTVAAAPSGACPGATFRYAWSIVARPSGSAAQLSAADAATPVLVPDVPGGAWGLQATVTDARGVSQASPVLTLQVEACGANPVLADVRDTPGARAWDGHLLAAIPAAGRNHYSDDDDPALCPTRFAHAYQVTWSVLSAVPAGTAYGLEPQNGGTASFSPGGNAVWSVQAQVSGGPATATVQKQVSAACADPLPRAGTVDVEGTDPAGQPPWPGRVPGRVFRDDEVMLFATPSSLCFSEGGTSWSYRWTLTPPPGSAAALSDPLSPAPSLVADLAGASWGVSLYVVDKFGNASPVVNAAVRTESCGLNPVTVALSGAPSPGARAWDPVAVSATAMSGDDDILTCPVRFAQTYGVEWSVSAPPGNRFSLSTRSATGVLPGQATATLFEVLDDGRYTVDALAVGSRSGRAGSGSWTRDVSCPGPEPVVTAPTYNGGTGPNAGQVNLNDVVTVRTTPSSPCLSPGNEGFTYQWTLGPVPGDTGHFPLLSDPAAEAPAFTIDAPGRQYVVGVAVTDKTNRISQAGTTTIASSSCGASPIGARIVATQAPGARPMDPWTLTAAPLSGAYFSADGDPSRCPVQFAPVYTFAWTPPALPSTIAPLDTVSATFTAGETGTHPVEVAVSTVAGLVAPAQATATVDSRCAAPAVGAPTIASLNGRPYPGGPLFNGDVLGFDAVATSACFASPAFTWSWSLTTAGGETLSSNTSPHPTLTLANYNAGYQLTVSAEDGSHQPGSGGILAFTSSGCGSSPPLLSLVDATQSFQSVVTAIDGAPAQATSMAIHRGPLGNPAATFDGASGPAEVPVPFYLETPLRVAVRVDDAPSSACPSYHFDSASLGLPTGSFALLTAPPAGDLSGGSELLFSFTPDVGDQVVNGNPVPGLYTLAAHLTYGRDRAFSTDGSFPLQVEGRCGMNTPVASFSSASSGQVNTAVAVDGSGSSDADNAVLAVATAPPSSAGCGLSQPLTWTWTLASKPDGSNATFTPPQGSTPASVFTPDVPGLYRLELVVDDGRNASVAADRDFTATP